MNLKIGNIPLINLRIEVQEYIRLFNTPKFCNQFLVKRKKNEAINTVYESWYGRNEVLLTEILRKCILNIESAVCTSVYLQSSYLKIINSKIIEAVNNPFSLGKKGTVESFYKALPSLLDDKYSLENYNKDLYSEVKSFYKNIRNPLFHGKELKEMDMDNIRESLKLIARLFSWLDSWLNLEEIIKIINISRIDENSKYSREIDQIIASSFTPEDDNDSFINEIKIPYTIDLSGMLLTDSVEIQYTVNDNKFIKLVMSPKTAMKTLAYLATAHREKGWPIPERL